MDDNTLFVIVANSLYVLCACFFIGYLHYCMFAAIKHAADNMPAPQAQRERTFFVLYTLVYPLIIAPSFITMFLAAAAAYSTYKLYNHYARKRHL